MSVITDRKIILASASPRRRELMKIYGLQFSAEISDAEENIPETVEADRLAEYYSALKAEDVFRRHKGEEITVIGADTVVVLDGIVFGKPHNDEDAFRMLRALSGRYHDVHTGVTVISGRSSSSPDTDPIFQRSFTSTTHVKFYELSDEQIRAYIDSGESSDKAGAYGIQGKGSLFVEKIDGDYFTVVGFPVAATARVLGI